MPDCLINSMTSRLFPFIMPVERNIYFANNDAYSIADTIDYLYILRERMNLCEFDNIISELFDMKFISLIDHNGPMYDPFSGQFIRRDAWFLRYGIRDRTIEYFDGCNAGSVGTFTVGDIEFTHEGEEQITEEEEEILIEGSMLRPIVLDDNDSEVSDLESVVMDDDNSVIVIE